MQLQWRVVLVVLAAIPLSSQVVNPAAPTAQLLPTPTSASSVMARNLLSGVLQACGGEGRISAAADFIAHGEISSAQHSGEATIRGKGESQFRMDMQIDSKTDSLAVSNGNGQYKSRFQNKTGDMPSYNAIAMESLTIPCLRIASALRDPNVELQDKGSQTLDGVSLHDIRVVRHFPKQDDPNDVLSALQTVDYFINPDFAVARMADSLRPNRASIGVDSRGQVSILRIPRTLYYSDFRTVNGISVPFSISEDVAQQHIWTLQISDINFNSGQSDDDFVLR